MWNIPETLSLSINNELSLKDRVILVTGASRGIGRAMAKLFSKHGATVILLARTVSLLESLYDEIEQEGYPTPFIQPFNLLTATPEEYETLAEAINQRFEKLDGILHNAAMLGTLTSIEQLPIEQWYQVIQLNLNAPFLLTQAILPLLKCATDASIIFTSAEVGRKARAYWGSYAVSKFGVEGLMQILADELETTTAIRVNSVNPGKIKTRLRKEAYPAEDSRFLMSPEVLESLYLYLMSPASIGVTGRSF